jgi:hypothetical protein
MTGRIPFGLLSLLSVLVTLPMQAQGQMGPTPADGVEPTGFHTMSGPDTPGQYHGIPLNYQRNAQNSPPPAAPTIFEQLPDDHGFAYDDTPLGNFLKDTFRHSFFRAEYLLWKTSSPGNTLLGAQPSTGVLAVNTPNPISNYGYPGNQQLTQGVQFARTVDGVTGIATTPGLESFSFNNMNGFRGTYGVPLESGQVELSAFILGRKSDTYFGGNTLASVYANGGSIGIGTGYIQQEITANPSVTIGGNVGLDGNPAVNGQTAQFITQPVLVNGIHQVLSTSSPGIDYDVSYQARLTTSAWGTEGNYVFNSQDPSAIFQFRPSAGFRYFNIQDKLIQFGSYNEPSSTDPTVNNIISRQINSGANNDLYGPQFGIRAEANHAWFSVGVEPKIMFAMNSWRSSLDTSNVFSSTDRSQALSTKGTTFSPLFDVRFYGNLALSKYLSAYAAYNYIWAGQVNRSYNDILYNQNSAGQSDFKLLRQFSGASLQGLSFGLELRY